MKYIEYKPQGNINIINIVMAIIITSIIGVILGWLYVVIAYIPLVYLNFLITIGFGYALAYSVQISSKILKIIDGKSRLLVLIVSVIIAYYSHWISFIVQVYSEDFPSFNDFLNYWIYPNNFFNAIGEINKYGTWSMFFKVPINGFTLAVVWIIEAGIIFYIPIQHILKFPENPFSEKINKWYPKFILDEEFITLYSSSKFISNLRDFGIDYIINLERGLAFKYAKISVFYLEGEDTQYLSVDTIFIETRNQSRESVHSVVKPIEISTAEAKKLFKKYRTKKEFYLDF